MWFGLNKKKTLRELGSQIPKLYMYTSTHAQSHETFVVDIYINLS